MNSLTLLHLASRATDSKTDSVIVKRYSFKVRGEVYRGTSTPEYDSLYTPYILVSNNTRLTHGLTQTTQLNFIRKIFANTSHETIPQVALANPGGTVSRTRALH